MREGSGSEARYRQAVLALAMMPPPRSAPITTHQRRASPTRRRRTSMTKTAVAAATPNRTNASCVGTARDPIRRTGTISLASTLATPGRNYKHVIRPSRTSPLAAAGNSPRLLQDQIAEAVVQERAEEQQESQAREGDGPEERLQEPDIDEDHLGHRGREQ